MIVTALVVIGLFVVMGFFFPVMFIAALAAAFLLALSFAAGFRRTKAEMEKADPGVDTLKEPQGGGIWTRPHRSVSE